MDLAPDAPAKRKKRKRPWSKRQGWILLGAFIVAAAGGLLAFLQLTQPRLARIEALSPIQVWSLWQDLRRGPDRNLSPVEQQFLEVLGIRRVWQVGLLAALAAGVLLMAAAYAIPARASYRYQGASRAEGSHDQPRI